MYILGSSAYLVAHYTMTTNPIAPVQSNTRLAVRARCFDISPSKAWILLLFACCKNDCGNAYHRWR